MAPEWMYYSKKGPPSVQTDLLLGGVGAFENRFAAVDQQRTHTRTSGGSRFHVPKVRRKGPPNAHPRPGLDGPTRRKYCKKIKNLTCFGVRVAAIEMTSPSDRRTHDPLGRPRPSLDPLYYYGAIEGREKM